MRARLVRSLMVTAMLAVGACGTADDGTTPGSDLTMAPDLEGKAPLYIGMSSADSGDRSNPDFADGLEAWVDYANSTNGIAGRPVELKRCDSKSLSKSEQQCSQELASDPTVLAVSGMGGFVGPMSVPTYEQSEVPMISVSMFVPQEYATPIGVALNGGLISTYAVLMEHFRDEGAESVSMMRVDVASGVAAVAQHEQVAGDLGLDWQGAVAVAPTVTDLLPSVTQALADEPDVLLTQVTPAQLKGILLTMETLDSDVPVLTAAGSITADILAMPEARDRLYYTSDFADPAQDEAHADGYSFLQERFGDGLTDAHMLGFILGEAFKDAIESSGGAEATRASVLEFVRDGTFAELPWMPKGISRADSPDSYPAVANLEAYVVRIDGDGEKDYVSDLITPSSF